MAVTKAVNTKESTRVLVSMPDKFLEEIDSFAKDESRTRSELIREALRHYFRQQKKFSISNLLD